MSKKKLVKQALKNPELYNESEILYFQMWLKAEVANKKRIKKLAILKLERDLLI